MNDEGYYRAKKISRAKKKLRSHVIVTLVIITFLGVLNAMTSAYPWFQWPALGLGLSLIIHALTVYGKVHLEQFEEKTMKKEMKKYGVEEEEFLDLKEEQELELDELPELRKEWKDSDFV